jgi:hypothetical protein
MAHKEDMRERVTVSLKAPRQPRRTVREVRRGNVVRIIRVRTRYRMSSPRAPAQPGNQQLHAPPSASVAMHYAGFQRHQAGKNMLDQFKLIS